MALVLKAMVYPGDASQPGQEAGMSLKSLESHADGASLSQRQPVMTDMDHSQPETP